jgi:hypothetical protein
LSTLAELFLQNITKSKKDQLQHKLSEVEHELNLLARAKQRMTESLVIAGPKVSAEGFENEITALTKEVTEINRRQEILRQVAVSQREALTSARLQIEVAEEAISEYRGDRKYLQNTHKITLRVQHVEPFTTRTSWMFLITLKMLACSSQPSSRLRQTEADLRKNVDETQQERDGLEDQYARIAAILDTRRGELKFNDVVGSLDGRCPGRS